MRSTTHRRRRSLSVSLTINCQRAGPKSPEERRTRGPADPPQPEADDTAAGANAAEPAAADLDPLTSLAQSYDNKEKLAPDVHD